MLSFTQNRWLMFVQHSVKITQILYKIISLYVVYFVNSVKFLPKKEVANSTSIEFVVGLLLGRRDHQVYFRKRNNQVQHWGFSWLYNWKHHTSIFVLESSYHIKKNKEKDARRYTPQEIDLLPEPLPFFHLFGCQPSVPSNLSSYWLSCKRWWQQWGPPHPADCAGEPEWNSET